jgi:hypothetical protein
MQCGGGVNSNEWVEGVDDEFPKDIRKAYARLKQLRAIQVKSKAEHLAKRDRVAALEAHILALQHGKPAPIHDANTHAEHHVAVATRAKDRVTRLAAIKKAIASQAPVLIPEQTCRIREYVATADLFAEPFCDAVKALRLYEVCRLENYDDLHPLDRAGELRRELAGNITTERRKEIGSKLAHLTSKDHSHLANSARVEVALKWDEAKRKIDMLATVTKYLIEDNLEHRRQKESDFFAAYGLPAHQTAITKVFEPLLREIEPHVIGEEQHLLSGAKPSVNNIPLLHFFGVHDVIQPCDLTAAEQEP